MCACASSVDPDVPYSLWPYGLMGYSPWGSQRVRHNWVTKHTHTHIYTLFHILFHYGLSLDVEYSSLCYTVGFPGGLDGKESACDAGDHYLISASGRSPGEGNGNPFQYSYLGNPWTEEPGGLQSMESQRTGYDWETHTFTFITLDQFSHPIC